MNIFEILGRVFAENQLLAQEVERLREENQKLSADLQAAIMTKATAEGSN